MIRARAGDSFSGHEINRSFLNTGTATGKDGSRFADATAVLGLGLADDGRALALSDWDGDGDLDIWASNRTAPRLRFMRNNSPPKSGYLAFRLRAARGSNRDAIGARLKLVLAGGTELLQTARAGSGFLSQSSKWLHFGLGTGGKPTVLEVTWPDGSREAFGGLKVNSRYHIVQGSGSAEPVPPRRSTIAAADAGAGVVLRQEDGGRTIVPGRIPLPNLSYTPAGKSEAVSLAAGERPMLLLLFSGSCPICASELAALSAHAKRIRDSGLEVLALSLDHLPGAEGSEVATQALERAAFPFPAGEITLSSADHLRLLLQSLHDFQAPFAVPLGLLLDPQRRLYGIYRGPAPVDLILHDASYADASRRVLRDLSVPYPGQWFTSPITNSELAEMVAGRFLEGFPEQHLAYLEIAERGATAGRLLQLRRGLASLYYQRSVDIVKSGGGSEAIPYLRKTLEYHEPNAAVHHQLGVQLANLGQLQEALIHVQRAAELDPSNSEAKQNLERLRELLKSP